MIGLDPYANDKLVCSFHSCAFFEAIYQNIDNEISRSLVNVISTNLLFEIA